jgi:hypothetical protein
VSSGAVPAYFKQLPASPSLFDAAVRLDFAARLPSGAVPISVNHADHKMTLSIWTDWLNGDTAGGKGDYELLSNFAKDGRACPTPTEIECRVRGANGLSAGNASLTCDKAVGSVCENSKQVNGQMCQDYEVRFLCTSTW